MSTRLVIAIILLPILVSGQRLISQSTETKTVEIIYDSIKVKAYEVKVKSIFPYNVDAFFAEGLKPHNVIDIAKPLAYLTFKDENNHKQWQKGYEYQLRALTLGLFPLGGRHYIFIEELDTENKWIQTREHNNLALVWDHRLSWEAINEKQSSYEDRVVIYTKRMNRFFAWYLKQFYKKRHRNWNKKLKKL